MALNCKLDRNITLSQGGEGVDYCNGQDISMGVGGIVSPVLVYNISDVPSLTFEGDNRSDYSLFVETINAEGYFYKVDHTDATYNEEYDPQTHKWTHTLTLTIANITPLFEDILSDGVNGKYLVCFRPNGAEDYRMFGWKWGATMDYSMNIQSDSLGYTLTFEDTSEYPLMTVDRDNFGNKNKTYTPIFKPLYDIYYCEQDGSGRHTGYIVAMYVVKVNAAGQPLGSDNKLCQWTGKKQDAYKIDGIQSDGGYNIIGTYQKTATFDGKPVKIYDLEKCPANVTNSIYINGKKAESINLNSTITGGSFTITSTDDWSMLTDPQYVTIDPVEGVNGATNCTLHHNGVGGCEQIQFMNKVTTEIVTLDVCINIINIGDTYTYPHGTTDVVLTPVVEGCDSAFTYTITPSVTSSKDADGNIHITFPNPDSELEYTLTTVHGCDPNETKVTKIYRKGIGTDPKWVEVNSWCETNQQTGQYTGWRINRYIDYNPNSSSYMQDKEEKVLDDTCSVGSAVWVEVEKYCELDVNGTNTGYYVSVLQDLNQSSPTYGQTQTTKALNLLMCPAANDNPKWILDPTFDPYCEQKVYEPSMIEGNTGRLIIRLFDDNLYSPTYNQYQESGVTEDDWTEEFIRQFGDFPCETPNTDPELEEVSYNCELSANTDDFLVMTGFKISTGMDKNPYSSTYLETTTARTYDPVLCPPNNPQPTPTGCSKFIVDGGEWGGVPASGDSTCDSAFLWVDGTPQFTPASASSWVDIQFVHWDEDPHTYQYFCTVYTDAPCVANDLMREAGIVDNTISCSDIPTPTMADMPQIVQDTITGNTKYSHALGTVRYNIAANNEGADRTCVIRWIVDSQECPSRDFTITQLGGSTPTGCTCTATGHKNPISSAVTTSRVDLGTYSSTCSGTWSATIKSGTDFLSDFSFSNGTISAKVSRANTGAQRTSVYTASNGQCSDDFTVVQAGTGTTPTTDIFEWDWVSHETHYTATTQDINLLLVPFSSVYNGVTTNAVLSANVPWIVTNSELYYNNNELQPNLNEYIYFNSYNTGSAPRTGTLTLTQKGTSNKITVDITQTVKPADCTITAFTLDSEVCRGGTLGYTFDVKSSDCHETFYFTLYDADNNQYESSTTPTGGHGTGSFTVPSSAATGQCSVTVYADRYYATIKDCTRTVTGKINNNSQYILQTGTFSYYVGSELRTVNFGGGVTPGSYRQVFITISTADYGKTWAASKVIATATSPTTKVDAEMNFNAYPSATTINDNFVGFEINLSDFKE